MQTIVKMLSVAFERTCVQSCFIVPAENDFHSYEATDSRTFISGKNMNFMLMFLEETLVNKNDNNNELVKYFS